MTYTLKWKVFLTKEALVSVRLLLECTRIIKMRSDGTLFAHPRVTYGLTWSTSKYILVVNRGAKR